MINKQPYFSIGERVLLASKEFPQYNGEYVVHDIIFPRCEVVCRISKGSMINKSYHDIGYCLDVPLPSPIYEGYEVIWAQSSLRKIYKPSNHTFDELMDSIKDRINIKCSVQN